jgi:hypothetical protein
VSATVRDCVFKAVAHRIREVEEDHAH